MKTLQNNFTTPEQSKRLLELGVPADSADCVHTYLGIKMLPENIVYSQYDWMVADGDHRIPCWSVGRLMEIFELCTSSKFERIKTKCSVLTDVLWQIEMYVTETSKGFCIDFSKLED